MKTIPLLLLSVLVAGCFSAGRPMPPEAMRNIVPHKTTRAEAERALGMPMMVEVSGGGTNLIWRHIEGHVTAGSFVPLVGGLFGGVKSRTETLTLMFDAGGLLTNITTKSVAMDTTPQRDTTLPPPKPTKGGH